MCSSKSLRINPGQAVGDDMETTERAAFLIAQAACAQAEIAGMTAENQQREHRGESMAYVHSDYLAVIDKYGIGHNAAILWLRDG